MKKFCIVIPIYKEKLNCIDKVSLTRLNKVIGNKYDIYLVKPKGLNTDEYYKLLDKSCVKEIEFKKSYFVSSASYSQLCIQYSFYNKFSKYEYMYIYQTDCYLVYDMLNEWCNKGYDYVGAAILALDAQWKDYKNKNYEPQVGNGGFSLRKISTFKELTDPNGEFRKYYNLTDEKLSKIEYEDKYFSNDLYNFYDLLKPNWIESLYFALDMNVDAIYDNFNFKSLPMGIHAWGKNIRYWKNILEELKDNTEVIDYCENTYKEYFDIYYNKPNDDNIKDIFRMYICAYNGYGKEYIPNEDYYEYVDYKNCDNKFNDTKLLYSEYYQIYDILTNRELPDYVGICHYRRYLKFNISDIDSLYVRRYDIILPKPYKFGINNYYQYIQNFDKYFLSVIKDILKEYYPDYLESYEYFLKDDKIYSNSIMITRKEIFQDYCKFVFDIFDKFLKYININSIEDIENYIDNNSDNFYVNQVSLSQKKTDNYEEYLNIRTNFSRICGFLGERLLNVYVIKNKLNILEKDIIIYEKQS